MKIFCRKQFIKFISVLLTFLLATTVYAQHEINIVNHFNQSLSFEVILRPEVLPDLSPTFTLDVDQETSSRVLSLGKIAYIQVKANENDTAIWGVTVLKNQTRIFRYESSGIAFSSANQTITFCTPEVFNQKGSC